MTTLSPYSPLNGGGRRRAAAVALCAGAVALVTGCSTGSTGSAASLTPRKAISLAADESHRVSSMAATFSEQVGSPAVAGTTGTMQLRLKPTLLAHEALRTSASGQTVSLEEIVSAKAIYVKGPTGPNGKPWIKIPLSEMSGSLGAALSSLLQTAQADNPAEQTQMLAASKDVRKVGTQVIDGVQTTHYTGTFTLSAALAALSPTIRNGLAPLLKMVSGDVRFNVWIDDQHVTRRVTEAETVSGQPVTVTLNVTAVNQPVQIALPPASEVTTLPKSALSSL
jgi:LppX_LprAFG lipoprotein